MNLMQAQAQNSALGDQWKQQREKQFEAFIDDSRFAKVVETPRGSAMRIGSTIVEIDCWGDHEFVVEAIVRALRRTSGNAESGSTGEQ